MPFFRQLVAQTDAARKQFESHPAVMSTAADGMTKAQYVKFLKELYALVWHFNPLSAASVARLTPEFSNIQQYLYQHMAEEAGHDEWVLNDLKAIGVEPTAATEHTPEPWTQGFIGFNYWVTEHEHPVAALGMLYTLEVVASVYGAPVSDALRESLFLQGDAGVTFLSSHAEADAEHMEELRVVLDTVENAAAQRAVINAVRVNYHFLTQIIEGVFA